MSNQVKRVNIKQTHTFHNMISIIVSFKQGIP